MKPKILIGLPTMGNIHTFLLIVILKWMADAQEKGDMNISIYPTMRVVPHDKARNEIVREFLQSDCTHLFFIDSDTVPPPDALRKLLAHDLEFVSGITPIIEHDQNRKNDSSGYYKKWNCVDMYDNFVSENTGLVPLKGAGGSCVLIKREVFEKISEPWYEFKDEISSQGNRKEVGEDIHFTIKAINAGFQPYADTSVIASHEKSILW